LKLVSCGSLRHWVYPFYLFPTFIIVLWFGYLFDIPLILYTKEQKPLSYNHHALGDRFRVIPVFPFLFLTMWLHYYCEMQLWDASSGQGFTQFTEHRKRTWSVSFSDVDPTKLASGSDDCCVKVWSINQACY
jgi:hypothetical protein